MKTPRFVYLSDYFGEGGPSAGGAGIAALDSYEILAASGVRTHLISGYFAPDRLAARADVTLLEGTDLRAGAPYAALGAIYNAGARKSLAQVLAAFDPADTIIVLHQWTRYLSPSSIALLSKFRLMVYMHDYFWFCPNGAYYDFRAGEPCPRTPLGAACVSANCDRAGYAHKAVRLARHAVKALITGGDPSRRVFLHVSALSRRISEPNLPKEQHRVVYNPLPSSVTRDAPQIEEPEYDVGYFGRLEPEKGVADAGAAVERAGYRALFVGDGALAEDLRRTLGPQAVVRWASRSDTLALMRKCRTVVLPSRWPETWGLVTAEALAQARPVVVSSRAGSSELPIRFGGGAVFDPGDPGALDAALAGVIDGGVSEAQSKAAASAVRRALAPQSHARRIVEIAVERWGFDTRDAEAA